MTNCANSGIAWDNIILDTSTIVTGATQATGFPLTNLQSIRLKGKWRSNTLTENISVVLGGPLAQSDGNFKVRFMALLATNLTESASIQVEAIKNGAGTFFEQLDISVTSFNKSRRFPNHVFLMLDQEITAKRLNFKISDPTNTDGYLEIGGLWASDMWQPEKGFNPGFSTTVVDQGQMITSGSRDGYPEDVGRYRQVQALIDSMDFSDSYGLPAVDKQKAVVNSPDKVFQPTVNNSDGVSADVYSFTAGPGPGTVLLQDSNLVVANKDYKVKLSIKPDYVTLISQDRIQLTLGSSTTLLNGGETTFVVNSGSLTTFTLTVDPAGSNAFIGTIQVQIVNELTKNPDISALDISFDAGNTEPVIIVPRGSDQLEIARTSVYGHISNIGPITGTNGLSFSQRITVSELN